MTISSTTVDQLDAIALRIEALTAANATIDKELHDLILEPAQVIRGQTLPLVAAYTANVITALNRLRPKGFVFSCGELYEPFPAPTHMASFIAKGPAPGQTLAPSAVGKGATLSIATCAAIARIWAQLVRQYLNLPET